MNIVSHFYKHAEIYPDKPALIINEESISYSQFKNKIDGKSSYFVSRGIKSGDRVLIFSSMNTDLYASLLGLFKIGAVAVIVDKWASLRRIRDSIKESNCKGILSSGKLKYLSFFLNETRSIPIKLSLNKEVYHVNQVINNTLSDDPALITFTTGSSGRPKATIRTHEFLEVQLQTITKSKKTTPEAIELIHLPILLMLNLANGSTSYIPKLHKDSFDKSNWDKIAAQVKQYKVNTMTCSPAFLEAYCNNTDPNNSINSIFCGGGSIYPELANKTINHFPFSQSRVVYGATEAEPISIGDFKDLASTSILEDRGLYVGLPHEELDIYIDRSIVSHSVHFGEILVKGKHVLYNYTDQQTRDLNKKEIDGKIWHKTGDLGFIKEGKLYFVGRVHEWNKGELLSPIEISATVEFISNSKGIIVQKNGQKILCIEGFDRDKEEILKNALSFDIIKVFKRLPRDPRHQTKVDYKMVAKQC